jgi:hypothetical protein
MKIFSKQLEDILNTYDGLRRNSEYDDLSDQVEAERQSLATRGIAAVNRIAGNNSSYAKEIIRIQTEFKYLHKNLTPIMGVVKALKADLDAGFIQSLIELAHSDIFANFLEMAEHLLESGYKDAAAVITGSTLESHLRELCIKNGIPTEDASGKGGALRPLKADRLNSELAKASVLTKLDQKNVTAWLDLRNKAAHGNYSEYTKDQVSLLISGISDFYK